MGGFWEKALTSSASRGEFCFLTSASKSFLNCSAVNFFLRSAAHLRHAPFHLRFSLNLVLLLGCSIAEASSASCRFLLGGACVFCFFATPRTWVLACWKAGLCRACGRARYFSAAAPSATGEQIQLLHRLSVAPAKQVVAERAA